ncbi:hypothetical protein EUBVEN_01004 [Eubacterium ventriosum ATCC 27560]|uniref:Uncharacterized protein n=1 Tax=Eubacterium ventriosum ATCC 27560 TaxID=411463 RepID=A5Z5M4_9FIRM|nr:hypothetical protein EUBVEN_01004 [Eubacterium ventriosum ATCC 27560]
MPIIVKFHSRNPFSSLFPLHFLLTGLLRASHSRNPSQAFAYREAFASLLCSFLGRVLSPVIHLCASTGG